MQAMIALPKQKGASISVNLSSALACRRRCLQKSQHPWPLEKNFICLQQISAQRSFESQVGWFLPQSLPPGSSEQRSCKSRKPQAEKLDKRSCNPRVPLDTQTLGPWVTFLQIWTSFFHPASLVSRGLMGQTQNVEEGDGSLPPFPPFLYLVRMMVPRRCSTHHSA